MTYRRRSVRTLWSMSRSMQAAPVGFSRFCTAGLPPAQRIIGWEQINATGLVGVRTRPLGDRPLQAAALKLVMPSLTAGRIRGAAHSVERGERQILEHPTGGAVLYAGLSGRGRFTTRRGSQEVLPGQGIICDADQVFTRTFSDGLDALLLTVPRSALRSGSRSAGLGHPLRFDFLPGAEDQPGGAAAAHSAWSTGSRRPWIQLIAAPRQIWTHWRRLSPAWSARFSTPAQNTTTAPRSFWTSSLRMPVSEDSPRRESAGPWACHRDSSPGSSPAPERHSHKRSRISGCCRPNGCSQTASTRISP